ncbi:MAG: sigma-54-dependent Fis family transcriptional regulator, partial [Candidatus Krumholzibacteria bacterium]|nr:sigma-54-dependent Fis family transcriptional regulator [Candidatus Krumholzibacteria bacterium]
MNKLKILVVEDDKLAQKVMGKHLSNHAVEFAGDMDAAVRKLDNGRYDICFLDLMLGENDDYSGLKLIPRVNSKGMYSVVMSSCDSEDIVNKAYKLGCNDFYVKGNEETNINTVLSRYLQKEAGFNAKDIFSHRFITEDPSTRAGIVEVLKYTTSDLPILILGHSGTGKTLLAGIIHEHSRREGEFVSINCSAYTEELLEAELFGYKKGAFTGADRDKQGLFEIANGGTLFLDEVGEMSENMQKKLLRVLQEGEIRPVGGKEYKKVSIRLLSATNKV